MALNYKQPRIIGRQAILETVPREIWDKNYKFSQKLIADIAKHPIANHPVKEFFDTETLTPEKSLRIHLEFGYGFAQVFTDAVLNAMAKATQLETRLGPTSKVTARFLWSINLMDEIGYVPEANDGQYSGNPFSAHYFQYVKMFKDLGSNERAILEYKPSPAAASARATFEDNYNDYLLLTSVLALSESIFDDFAGPWARNTGRSTGIDVSEGYHTIHVKNDEGESVDDAHSEDSWFLVRQALTPDRYAEVEVKMQAWLDSWYAFADQVLKIGIE